MKPEFKPRPSDSSAHTSNYQILLSTCYDHAMDEIRYFAATVAGKSGPGGFVAGCVERKVI